jgi:plasmid stabilization system protein ParE
MVVVWASGAKAELQKTFNYIAQDSLQNADKVITDLLEYTAKLANHPEFYPPDKYKKSNDGTWRAFELHRYRISYLIKKDQIRIVRMRHTSMSPLSY